MFRSLSFISQSMVFSCSRLLVYFQHTTYSTCTSTNSVRTFLLVFFDQRRSEELFFAGQFHSFSFVPLPYVFTVLEYTRIIETFNRVPGIECTVMNTVVLGVLHFNRSQYSTPCSSLCRTNTKATFFFISTSSQFEFTHFFPHLPFTQLTQSLAVSLFLRRSRSALLAKENEARYWNFLAFVLSCE